MTDTAIYVINISCILIMVILMLILSAATRMKGGAGYAAAVSITTTVPVYLSNLMRTFGTEGYEISYYFAIFLNVICFPSLWFFVRSQLDSSFRFDFRILWHGIPAVVSLVGALVYYDGMTEEEFEADRLFLEAGNENLPALINDVLLFGQFFIYFYAIFRFIRKRRKYLQNNYADSDFLTLRWISGYLTLFFVLFFIVFIAYVIDPRTDAWLIPILNTIGVAYLVYVVMYHSMRIYIRRVTEGTDEKTLSPDAVSTEESVCTLDEGQMKSVCEQVQRYLSTSRAYLRPDLSLAMLSRETGIPQKILSRSINGYLKNNFFELVNAMRVEKAKELLLLPETADYTIDSIYESCGFRSRSTFFLAFKKAEGKTPAQWLKSAANE